MAISIAAAAHNVSAAAGLFIRARNAFARVSRVPMQISPRETRSTAANPLCACTYTYLDAIFRVHFDSSGWDEFSCGLSHAGKSISKLPPLFGLRMLGPLDSGLKLTPREMIMKSFGKYVYRMLDNFVFF